jgi:transcriptional regulator with XRE-family HTH domain
MKTLGARIKKLRMDKKLTQSILSEKLQLSSSAIGMYERDERQPDMETLIKFAKFFEVSTDYLLGYDHKKNRSTEAMDFENNIKIANKNAVYHDLSGLSESEIELVDNFIRFIKSNKKDKGN